MPPPFSAGTPRPAGVHLHWAMPDALLRGALAERPDGSANRLGLPVLPDRWVVLRLAAAGRARRPVVTGWVLEADRAVAVPLAEWTEALAASTGAAAGGRRPGARRADRHGRRLGRVGGRLRRRAQPLRLPRPAGRRRHAWRRTASTGHAPPYLVAGWWSDAGADPLDAARSNDSLHELLDRLRWRLLYEWGDAKWDLEQGKAEFELKKALGLTTEERWSSPRPPKVPRAAGGQLDGDVPADGQGLHDQAGDGRLVGVRHRHRASGTSRRPGTCARRCCTARCTACPSPADPTSTVVRRRRRCASPSAGTTTTCSPRSRRRRAPRPTRVATPSGCSARSRRRRSAGLARPTASPSWRSTSTPPRSPPLPGGSAGTDRFLQRVQTGGVGGNKIGRGRHAVKDGTETDVPARRCPRRGAGTLRPGRARRHASRMQWTERKPDLIVATALQVHEVARSRVGDVLAAVEPRVVDRPAARFTFPDDPLVAVRGGGRSLRHGNDGRGSADGKLTCRWPTHVITEISGVIAKDRFIRSLGNGGVPTEVLTLAREALLHDPYHDAWIAGAVSPDSGTRAADLPPAAGRDGAALRRRRHLRRRHPGAPARRGGGAASPPGPGAGRRRDGARRPADTAAGGRRAAPLLAVQGRRPGPRRRHRVGPAVGAALAGVAGDDRRPRPCVDRRLAARRHRPRADRRRAAGRRQPDAHRALAPDHRARPTLHDAIHDWLTAENARDVAGGGEASRRHREGARDAGRRRRAPRHRHARRSTAFRSQLLGLAGVDGCAARRAARKPAPVTSPTLLAGRLGAPRPRPPARRLRPHAGAAGGRRRRPDPWRHPGRPGRAAPAATARAPGRAGSSASSTPPRRPAPKAPRRASTRSRPASRSTRSPASCCPTTSTRASRSSPSTAARSASCCTSPSAAG